jgi:hypothetical protein
MSLPTRPRRTLEDLGTCPPEMLVHYRGDCLSCRRPTATKHVMARIPELSRWFMRANGELCSTCYCARRAQPRPTTRAGRRQDHSNYVHRVTERDVVRLRAMVGACVGCGWTSDSGAHRRFAPTCPQLPTRARAS